MKISPICIMFIKYNVYIYAERANPLNKNQDNKNNDNDSKQQAIMHQQFMPGRGPDRPPSPPGQNRPGGQPPSAPPNFIPQLPREEEQQLFSGPTGFRGPGGGIIDFRRRPRDFHGCINRFTFIWLTNGNNFWFYPVFVGNNSIEGFSWRRNRWEYDRLLINRILFHICF